jgi:hypothetical protein
MFIKSHDCTKWASFFPNLKFLDVSNFQGNNFWWTFNAHVTAGFDGQFPFFLPHSVMHMFIQHNICSSEIHRSETPKVKFLEVVHSLYYEEREQKISSTMQRIIAFILLFPLPYVLPVFIFLGNLFRVLSVLWICFLHVSREWSKKHP